MIDSPPAEYSHPSGQSAISQRRHARHFCLDAGRLRFSIRPEFRGRHAVLVDVSSGGIGILLEEALEIGTVLVFEMAPMRGGQALGRVARVRNQRTCSSPADAPWLPPAPLMTSLVRRVLGWDVAGALPDCWLMGCEFDRPLSDQELTSFLEGLKQGAVIDED
jgi:hypothetical protein